MRPPPTMMVTPEMMEALGAKRGKARGPDMTNVVVSEATEDSYAGSSSLEEAVGRMGAGKLNILGI